MHLSCLLTHPLTPFLLLFPVLTATSQTFLRTYGSTGSETGTCIQKTPDGNYIVCGVTTSFGAGLSDGFLMKTDTAGNLLWTKAYGGTYNDWFYYVHPCSDSGYVMSGYTTSFKAGQDNDFLIVKTDSAGNLEWARTIAAGLNDNGWFVNETTDGGFLATGSTSSFSSGNFDGWFLKFDSAGNLLWTKTFGGTAAEELLGMSKTSDGGFIATGYTGSNTFGSADIILIKLNGAGDTVWTKQYGSIREEAGYGVVQTSDNGYIICADLHNINTNIHHAGLIKTDSAGNLLWYNTFGGTGGEFGYWVQETPDKGFAMLGNTPSFGGGGYDFFHIKTDSAGNKQWAKAYGGISTEDAWYFVQETDGSFALCGSTDSFGAGQFDVLLVKADSDGGTSCKDVSIQPDSFPPVLQTRSGLTMSSGGAAVIPSLIVTSGSFAKGDPCGTVGVLAESDTSEEVIVFPNPSEDGKFTIQFSGSEESVELCITDVCGKEVHRQFIRSPQEIHLRVPPGIYFYQIALSLHAGKILIR